MIFLWSRRRSPLPRKPSRIPGESGNPCCSRRRTLSELKRSWKLTLPLFVKEASSGEDRRARVYLFFIILREEVILYWIYRVRWSSCPVSNNCIIFREKRRIIPEIWDWPRSSSTCRLSIIITARSMERTLLLSWNRLMWKLILCFFDRLWFLWVLFWIEGGAAVRIKSSQHAWCCVVVTMPMQSRLVSE